jgi:hypothetical protein
MMLSKGNGYGYINGYINGYGDGDGNGNGNGYINGNGNGNGDGDGDGYGNGYGIGRENPYTIRLLIPDVDPVLSVAYQSQLIGINQ